MENERCCPAAPHPLRLHSPQTLGWQDPSATYIGDCVAVEFSHGLYAFEVGHHLIATFYLHHCLQGREERPSNGANQVVSLHGSS